VNCSYFGQAEPVVRGRLAGTERRFGWRHLPLTDLRPAALPAADASEAAADHGKFLKMHNLLLDTRRTSHRPTSSASPTTSTSMACGFTAS
jgi:hypothetical protein